MKPRVMSLVIFTCAVGLLIAPAKINFINAALVAEERGISFSNTLHSESISYSNLIKTYISTEESNFELSIDPIFGNNVFIRILD